jgi:hypothetical protein
MAITLTSQSIPAHNWPSINTGTIPYGWAGEIAYPNRTNYDDHLRLYVDMVQWILELVERPYNNALWTKIGDCIYVQFRKEKDMVWFQMKFGA